MKAELTVTEPLIGGDGCGGRRTGNDHRPPRSLDVVLTRRALTGKEASWRR